MSAVFRFLIWGAMPIGSAIAGGVGASFGLRPAIAVGAVGQVLCIPFLWSRRLLTSVAGDAAEEPTRMLTAADRRA
jgi:hypothetical protein